MPSDSRQLKKVATKGLKKMYGSSSGNKIQITILAYANGMGNVLPPMIIFKEEHFNHDWAKERFLIHGMVCLPMVGLIRLNDYKDCLFQTYHQHGQFFFF